MSKKLKKEKISKIPMIKKLKAYLFYIRLYPQAVLKAIFFLVTNPKKFLNKIQRVEKIVTPVLPENQSSFNFLQFLSPKKIIKALKILFTKGPKGVIEKIKIFLYKSQFIYLDKKILQEFNNYFKKRKDNHFDIFIFGITAFDFRIQRPQHFAFELAKKDHRIFYIENEFLIN